MLSTWVKVFCYLLLQGFFSLSLFFSLVSRSYGSHYHIITCLHLSLIIHIHWCFVAAYLCVLSHRRSVYSAILPGGGSGSRRSLLWLQLQRQPVLRHFSSGTFLWHHKFLHFLWPALGGYKGHTWPVIVCLALSSVSLLLLLVTSSRARLSDCLKIHTSLRSGRWSDKKQWFIWWVIG